MSFIIMLLMMLFGLSFIPASVARKKGYNFIVWWLFGFVAFPIALIIACSLTDNEEKEKRKFEEIKKYKELLDMGIITQEEFDAKKVEILYY